MEECISLIADRETYQISLSTRYHLIGALFSFLGINER